MARIPLVCPIDGTRLGGVTQDIIGQFSDLVGDPAQLRPDSEQHIHLTLSFTPTCNNGHTWRTTADIILERI